jgi:hypothetical protein
MRFSIVNQLQITKRKRVLTQTLVVALLLGYASSRSTIHRVHSAPDNTHGVFRTSFPNQENPISEGGQWINGQAAGLDWGDVRTIPGRAFGTDGKVRYADSTALLGGAWGPNQTAQATVHTLNQNDRIYEEVELRLRSSLSPHNATGYEINFRCLRTREAYTQIVRWNGRLGSFNIIKAAQGQQFGVSEGDVVRATISGDTITSYINGVEVLQVKDSTYASGNPGMGFYLEGATGINRDFGFTRFAATDGPPQQLFAFGIKPRPDSGP